MCISRESWAVMAKLRTKRYENFSNFELAARSYFLTKEKL